MSNVCPVCGKPASYRSGGPLGNLNEIGKSIEISENVERVCFAYSVWSERYYWWVH